MGKIKRLAFVTILAAVVSVVAACGRNDNSNSTPYVNDVTAGEYGSTESNESGSYTEETGGVLEDMVNDVEQGIDHVTDDTESGTNGTTNSSNGPGGQ